MQDTAKQYSTIKHRIALVNIFLSPLLLWVFLILGILAYIKNISQLASHNDYINLVIFYICAGTLFYILNLPLGYYSEFLLERRFSLSNQTLKDWSIREVKKNLVAFIITCPLIIALYSFLKLCPLDWWLWTAVIWFFASILIAKFAPIIIIPLFYKYSPIKDASLESRLNQLVSKVGFKAGGVYELNISKDTKKANAALLGLGRQKRIVLCDTLIANFNHDEIESVMAHELGHHKLNHMWKLIILGGIFTFISFFFTNNLFLRLHNFFKYNMLYDYESIILIYFIISCLNIAVIPIANAFSRRLEKNADEFALKATGNPGAFITAMKKLSEQNLTDEKPPMLYEIMLYDHPPIARRIVFAESFKQNIKNTPK